MNESNDALGGGAKKEELDDDALFADRAILVSGVVLAVGCGGAFGGWGVLIAIGLVAVILAAVHKIETTVKREKL